MIHIVDLLEELVIAIKEHERARLELEATQRGNIELQAKLKAAEEAVEAEKDRAVRAEAGLRLLGDELKKYERPEE